MIDPALPADIGAQFRALEERIKVLETAPRLNASATRGTFTVLDASGTKVAEISSAGIRFYSSGVEQARLDPNGVTGRSGGVDVAVAGTTAYGAGIRVNDSANRTHFLATTGAGIVFPYLATPWLKTNDFTAVTSATFTSPHFSWVELFSSKMFRFTVQVGTDAGTTGDLRVLVAGTQLGNIWSLSAGTLANHEFVAAHGQILDSGPWVVELQARRTGGTGNVNVYRPSGLVSGASSADGGGFPVVSGGWHTI